MNDVRKLITLVVLGIWAITLIIVLILIVTQQVGLEGGLQLLAQFSGVTSGFVGIIIGYYFTKDK